MSKNATRGGRGGGIRPVVRAAPSTANVPVPSSTGIYYGGVKDTTGKTVEYSAQDDQCPVCKTERYFSTRMRLLVSTCYHRMCESCIERLYALGPAPCPICGTTLRKLAFSVQTFEDLQVEKEIAVRKRMAKEFNKRREDFSDLRTYNDYLEWVENMTFNLINNLEVEKTEAEIVEFKAQNAALIELNIQREERDIMNAQEEEERDMQERLERAKDMRLEEEHERQEKTKHDKEILELLAKGNTKSAERLVAKARATAAKRQQDRNAALNAATLAPLKRREGPAAIPDPPHKPLSDDIYAYEDKYVLRREYVDSASEDIRGRLEKVARAGGYRLEDAWERAIRCAVSGLEISPLVGLPGLPA